MSAKMEQGKINWLLILQGWTMLWVVIGHANLEEVGANPLYEEFLYEFAYSFHMPLFMAISGWLFYRTRLKPRQGDKEWTYGRILWDKCLRILVPGLFFSLLAFGVKYAFPNQVSRQVSLRFMDVIKAFLYPVENPFQEIWFLVTLFWLFVLTPLWKVVLKKWPIAAITFFALVVLSFFAPKTELLCIDRVCKYAVWFYSGLLICRYNAVDYMSGRTTAVVLILSLSLYVIGRFYSSFLAIAAGIVMSASLSLLLDRSVSRIFFSFRNYTYQIFLMGIFVQILVKILYRNCYLPYLPAYLTSILAGVYIPVLISMLLKKSGFEPLLLLCGLKQPSRRV